MRELAERELAVALPRQPGERGQRYAHRLAEPGADAVSAPAEAAPPAAAPAPAGDGLAGRVERLESEVAALRELVDSLRAELGA